MLTKAAHVQKDSANRCLHIKGDTKLFYRVAASCFGLSLGLRVLECRVANSTFHIRSDEDQFDIGSWIGCPWTTISMAAKLSKHTEGLLALEQATSSRKKTEVLHFVNNRRQLNVQVCTSKRSLPQNLLLLMAGSSCP